MAPSGPRGREKLTAKKVDSLMKPGRYGDGGGLYLQVSKWKKADNKPSKSWIFRYQRNHKVHDMGLGPYPPVTLAKARLDAGRAKAMLVGLEPADPLATRKARNEAERAEVARRVTFKEAATKYIASHKAAGRTTNTQRNGLHRWRITPILKSAISTWRQLKPATS